MNLTFLLLRDASSYPSHVESLGIQRVLERHGIVLLDHLHARSAVATKLQRPVLGKLFSKG